MADPGMAVNYTLDATADPPTVTQQIGTSIFRTGNYLDETEIMATGPTSFLVTRRFLPTWALVAAIVGLFFFFIGIIFIFFRTTEQLRIDVEPGPDGGSTIRVSGTGTQDLFNRVGAVASGAPILPMGGAPYGAPGGYPPAQVPGGYPPGQPVPGQPAPYGAPPVPGPPPAAPAPAPAPASEAGWKPDPKGAHQFRWWDGGAWTAQVADDGVTTDDPL